MRDEEFWAIVEAARREAAALGETRIDAISDTLACELTMLTPSALVAFRDVFDRHARAAYTWDLWGAATVIAGRCSDDSFSDFRSWLISTGADGYACALADADALDSLTALHDDDDVFIEALDSVVLDVYEETTGSPMPTAPAALSKTPRGERWQQDDDLARRLPRLWRRFREAGAGGR